MGFYKHFMLSYLKESLSVSCKAFLSHYDKSKYVQLILRCLMLVFSLMMPKVEHSTLGQFPIKNYHLTN